MTYTKAKGTFINPGSTDDGYPRWFILDSADPNRVRVYYSEARRDKSFSDQKWHEEANPNPKSWYNIEEEEPVSEFSVGDRVKVEYAGVVKSGDYGDYVLVQRDGTSNVSDQSMVYTDGTMQITKLAPALPTKRGSVIDSHGYRFMLTAAGWHGDIDKMPYTQAEFETSRYAKDFTVVLEGK